MPSVLYTISVKQNTDYTDISLNLFDIRVETAFVATTLIKVL